MEPQPSGSAPGCSTQPPITPFWLRPVRCLQHEEGCSEYTTQQRRCTLEELGSDGPSKRVWRCQEVARTFRVCAGRPPEQTGYTVIETQEPEVAPQQAPAGDEILSPETGQLLDEFFSMASELKDSIRAGWASGETDKQERPVIEGRPGLWGLLFGRHPSAGGLTRGSEQAKDGGPAPSSQILAQYALPKQDV